MALLSRRLGRSCTRHVEGSYRLPRTAQSPADRPADTGNRVVEDATHTYQYDDEGNLTRETEKATGEYQDYTWDHRNQLTRVELRTQAGVLTTAVKYDYDAFHRLIRRRVDTDGNGTFDEAQKFTYDDTQIVLVFDDAGAVTNRLLWGPAVDQLFSDENAVNDVLWALTDSLGSVRDVAEYDSGTETTTLVNRLDYDAFGNVVLETDPAKTPLFKFTGRYTDPVTGKQYNWRRWYTPRTGTWMSQDPIGFAAGDANLRRYVGNSPTKYTDPSGLAEWSQTPNWHHIFPQEFAGELPRNIPAGFIHSPGNGYYLLAPDHADLHPEWNRDWDRWIKENPGFEFDDLLDQMNKMLENYGLTDENGCPLKGMPVYKADRMPYDVWKRGKAAQKGFRNKNAVSAWTPSGAEKQRNRALAKCMGRADTPGRLPGGRRLPPGLRLVGPAAGVIGGGADAYAGWGGNGKHPGVGGVLGAGTNVMHGGVMGPQVEGGFRAAGGGIIYGLGGGQPNMGINHHGVHPDMPGGF